MLKEFKMIEAVAPDMLDVLQERFQILRNIYGCNLLDVEVYQKRWELQSESCVQKQMF